MGSKGEECLKLAEYDLESARVMLDGGRYGYVVFMCHLALEKALKGIVHDRQSRVPPKAHNLVYLLRESGLAPPVEVGRLLVRLSEASIATRYPEDLATLTRTYTFEVANTTLAAATEALAWISAQLSPR